MLTPYNKRSSLFFKLNRLFRAPPIGKTTLSTLLLITGSFVSTQINAAVIEGITYSDRNSNGQFDPWEAGTGFNDEVITLWNSDQGLFSTRTDAQGRYRFNALTTGEFIIRADDLLWNGFVQTDPVAGDFPPVEHTVNISSNSQTMVINFGYRNPNEPPNRAPVITGGSTTNLSVDVGDTHLFDGVFTDADANDSHVFSWEFSNGDTFSTQAVNYQFNQIGTHNVSYTVTDNSGASDTQAITVTVNNLLPQITASANTTTISVENSIRFSGTISDTAGDTHTVEWNFGDDNTANSLTAEHTYRLPGNYTATLIVTDNHGGQSRQDISITITNETPVISIDNLPDPIRIGDTVSLTGEVVDPNLGDTPRHQWLINNSVIASTATASHTFTQKGSHTITYAVTDSYGEVGTATTSVVIRGAVPVVTLSGDNEIAVDVGEITNLSGTFTDADNGTHSYIWHFGDNSSLAGTANIGQAIDVTHVFMQASPAQGFQATLEIIDEEGNTGQQSLTVHVRGLNTDPCNTSVPTIRSQRSGAWINPAVWEGNRIPTSNDWVAVSHTVTLIDNPRTADNEARARVRGLCVESSGILRSNTGQHGLPSPSVDLSVGILHNQGIIRAEQGINASGPFNSRNAYNRATAGSDMRISAGRLTTTQGSQIITGRGGDDLTYNYFNSGWTRMPGSVGATGGKIDILPSFVDNHGQVISGRGGHAKIFNRGVNNPDSGWTSSIGSTGTAYAGDGGRINLRAINTSNSTNHSTGQVISGNGGDAVGTSFPRTRPGVGGSNRVDVGRQFGLVRTGSRGRQSFRRPVRTRWDPILLEASATTRIEGSDEVVIFAGDDAKMDLTKLVEGAVSANQNIIIAVGKGGTVDLRGVSAEVFNAPNKLSIFADNLLLDAGISVDMLTTATNVEVGASKIIYDVSLSTRNFILGQPNEVANIDIIIQNDSPAEDSYNITVTDTQGWVTQTIPQSIEVGELGRSVLRLSVVLPVGRGNETLITVTATSENDSTVNATETIRLGVAQVEPTVPPRGNELADIVIAIEDTATMGSDLITASNALEAYLVELISRNDPAADRIAAFWTQFDANILPTEEQIMAFETEITEAFPDRDLIANLPIMELVTFKEQAVSRVVTRDFGVIVTQLRTLSPSGGETCANGSIQAIDMALENIRNGGEIIIVTGSSATTDAQAVIAEAQAKEVKAHIMLTNACDEEEANKVFYQTTAEATKGTFNWLASDSLSDSALASVWESVLTNAFSKFNGTEPVGEYSVSGVLHDKAGQAIVGATIEIGDFSTVSDATGAWEISGLTENDYTAIVTKDGRVLASQAVGVGNQNFDTEVDISVGSVLTLNTVPSTWKSLGVDSTLTLTFTLSNQGEQTATNVVLTERLPRNAEALSFSSPNATCDVNTLTCQFPDLAANESATAELVLGNLSLGSLKNVAIVSSNEYESDLNTLWNQVKPYLFTDIVATPNPVSLNGILTYEVTVGLDENAPIKTATGGILDVTLPDGVEIHSFDFENEESLCSGTTNPKVIRCTFPDLSIENAEDLHSTKLIFRVILKDMGLLSLSFKSHVTANEYPTPYRKIMHTRTQIGADVKVDFIFVIDTTNSMQEEIDGVKQALERFTVETFQQAQMSSQEPPTIALVGFKDTVKVLAATNDMFSLLNVVNSLKAEGGGECHEASAEALDIALDHIVEGGQIAFVTDASAYPDANIDALLTRFQVQNVRLHVLGTGSCENKESWNTPDFNG